MTITAAAAEMIRGCLERSDISHPVVHLCQVSKSPDEIERAIARGADQKEIREIALRTIETETRYLYPAIFPRSHFLWFSTTMIAGFRFAYYFAQPAQVRSAMKRGALDVAERGLVLTDEDGTVVLPRSPTPK